MKKIVLAFLLICPVDHSWTQTDSLKNEKKGAEITMSAFVDVFYVFDLAKPTSSSRQSFLYNHNRHNEFNLNLGIAKMNINHQKYRVNLGFQGGTYVQDNYANEPIALKYISEANVGLALNKKQNLWLDAGIFASHIGFESAISLDNWTLTRSILAENSPYFLSGAKITYQPNEKIELSALACNGWQRIAKVQGNTVVSSGTQFKWKPSERLLFNWSTFIGTDDPDSTRRWRYFNNFYMQVLVGSKLGLIAGFDYGIQQKTKNSEEYSQWMSPVLILQANLSQKWKVAARAEYYMDEDGVIITAINFNPFSCLSFSINADYQIEKDVLWRTEVRTLNSKDEIFSNGANYSKSNIFIGTSLALRLNKKLHKS